MNNRERKEQLPLIKSLFEWLKNPMVILLAAFIVGIVLLFVLGVIKTNREHGKMDATPAVTAPAGGEIATPDDE